MSATPEIYDEGFIIIIIIIILFLSRGFSQTKVHQTPSFIFSIPPLCMLSSVISVGSDYTNVVFRSPRVFDVLSNSFLYRRRDRFEVTHIL